MYKTDPPYVRTRYGRVSRAVEKVSLNLAHQEGPAGERGSQITEQKAPRK